MKTSAFSVLGCGLVLLLACGEFPTSESPFQEASDSRPVPAFRHPVSIFTDAVSRVIMPANRLTPIGFSQRYLYGFAGAEPFLEDADDMSNLPMMVAADGSQPDPDCSYNVETSTQDERDAYVDCANDAAAGASWCVEERYYGGPNHGDVHLHCYHEESLSG